MAFRRYELGAVLAFGLLMMWACRGPQAQPEPTQPPAQQPVEEEERTPQEEPMQVTEVPQAEGWRYSTLIENLEHPWSLAFLPGGDMLITERPGRLRMVRNGELLDQPIPGGAEVLVLNQGGLLDLSLHPDFESNRLIYMTYASGTEQENRTTLARGRLESDRLHDVEVLYEAVPPKSGGEHFGSRLLWLPDGTLLMSIGDGGNPPREIDGILARDHAQRLDTSLGSIIRLNDDGSIPDDNPFVDREDARPEIYSYGHRNIQGMALDPDTGNVWVNDHGPLGGDELNLVQRGENHGWPLATYGADYRTGERFAEYYVLPDGVAPKAVWTPAKAPSGIAFYTADVFEDWQGDLFSGGLVGQEVRRIVLENHRPVAQETLPIPQRVRLVAQGPDGFLYVLTDEPDGQLLRIEPAE